MHKYGGTNIDNDNTCSDDDYSKKDNHTIATLALSSQPKHGLAKVQAENEAQESHFMLPRVQEGVRE